MRPVCLTPGFFGLVNGWFNNEYGRLCFACLELAERFAQRIDLMLQAADNEMLHVDDVGVVRVRRWRQRRDQFRVAGHEVRMRKQKVAHGIR